MKQFLFCTALIVAFVFGSCSPLSVYAEQEWPLKIWYQNQNSTMKTWHVVDDDTGVNYIVVSQSDVYKGGVSITPRLNADGSLYVTE